MRAPLLGLLGFAIPGAIAVAQSPGTGADSLRPISVQEAVALAQRNAPAAVQARGQLRTTAASVRSAYGAFFPTLTASASQSKESGQRLNADQQSFSDQPWRYSAGVNANLEIFDGGRRFADLRARKADVDAAEANETSQRFNIALQVRREYANILAARESEAAARAQLEQAEAQLRASIARVQAGAATVSDSLRSLIQVGNARLALLTAENNVRDASAALTRLVGTSFKVTADPADTLALPIVPIDSAALAALAAKGPAVQQAERQLAAAQAQIRVSRASYMPWISATYRHSGSGTDPYGFGNGQFLFGSTTSLSLNFPIFNNFNREEQVVRTRVAQDNSAAQLRDARLAAQQSLVQQLGALGTAEQRIRIQQSSVLAAQEDLRVQQQRYALGASTLLDLLTSQLQLNQARAALIQARQDYRIARAQIEAIIGRDMASL